MPFSKIPGKPYSGGKGAQTDGRKQAGAKTEPKPSKRGPKRPQSKSRGFMSLG